MMKLSRSGARLFEKTFVRVARGCRSTADILLAQTEKARLRGDHAAAAISERRAHVQLSWHARHLEAAAEIRRTRLLTVALYELYDDYVADTIVSLTESPPQVTRATEFEEFAEARRRAHSDQSAMPPEPAQDHPDAIGA